jgi:hypothetical protein
VGMDGVICCVDVQLDEFGDGSFFSDFPEFLESGFETVRLRKGGTKAIGVRIVKQCYTQKVHGWIWVDRGWVVIVVTCVDTDVYGAVLVGPIRIRFVFETDLRDAG